MIKSGVQLTGSNSDLTVINIKKPQEYLHRILGGGIAVETVYYPYLHEDEDTGDFDIKWKVLKKPVSEDCPILDALHAADSQFRPDRKWLFLVIDKTDPEPKIKIAQYPYTVAAKIVELEKKRDISDPKYLRYGPTFAWDCIINHVYDASKKGPAMSKHSYTVEVGSHDFDGMFPVEFLNRHKHPNPINDIPEEARKDMFSDEEWGAIQTCNIDLGEYGKPNTEHEILQSLAEKPVLLSATRTNPTTTREEPVFAKVDDVNNVLLKHGLKAIAERIDEMEALPEHKEESGEVPFKLNPEKEVSVNEEEEDTPAVFDEEGNLLPKKEAHDSMKLIKEALKNKEEGGKKRFKLES